MTGFFCVYLYGPIKAISQIRKKVCDFYRTAKNGHFPGLCINSRPSEIIRERHRLKDVAFVPEVSVGAFINYNIYE